MTDEKMEGMDQNLNNAVEAAGSTEETTKGKFNVGAFLTTVTLVGGVCAGIYAHIQHKKRVKAEKELEEELRRGDEEELPELIYGEEPDSEPVNLSSRKNWKSSSEN